MLVTRHIFKLKIKCIRLEISRLPKAITDPHASDVTSGVRELMVHLYNLVIVQKDDSHGAAIKQALICLVTEQFLLQTTS